MLNSGISDSGLLTHLSEATAGSLNGVGHSTIYEELATYSYDWIGLLVWLGTIRWPVLYPQFGCRLLFPRQRRLRGSPGTRRWIVWRQDWAKWLWGTYLSLHRMELAPFLTIYLQIPWALRDVIADERVAHFFSNEIVELRDAFREWLPKTSILRDIKKKLQPIQRLPSSILKDSVSKLWICSCWSVRSQYLYTSNFLFAGYVEAPIIEHHAYCICPPVIIRTRRVIGEG